LTVAGRLIGITTAILSHPERLPAWIAVPSDDVNQVVTQLIAKGQITRPR